MTTMHAPAANAEANLYGMLAELLAFPSKGLVEIIESGLLQLTIETVSRDLPHEVELASRSFAPAKLSATVLEAEYIRLFDMPDRVPTPLYTGVYAPRRRDAMEELLRVYRHFGLTVSSDSHDLPDFVPTVLEFLQVLARGNATTGESGSEPRERAMADVLERHLCPWAEQTSERLARRGALPFYQALVDFVEILSSTRRRELRACYPATTNAASPMGYRPSR